MTEAERRQPEKLIDGEVLAAMRKLHPAEAMIDRGEARIVWTREVST